jgi:predicted phosphodiesterase
MTKFRVISDLHVEFYAHPNYLQRKLTKLYPSIDPKEILIIAGDLGVAGSGISKLSMNPEYRSMLEYFAKRWNTVILVPGNHEYYDRDRYCSLDDVDEMIRFECKKLNITFLNKECVKLRSEPSVPKDSRYSKSNEQSSKDSYIYILGCTLWSQATPNAYKGMNDKLKAILSHKELLSTHQEHKEFLESHLQKILKKQNKFSKENSKSSILVITHHLPLQELTHPKYLTEEYKALNSAYASNLSLLMESTKSNPYTDSSHPIKNWFCGHTHEMTKAAHHGIQFFINPMGYPRESRVTKTETEVIEI